MSVTFSCSCGTMAWSVTDPAKGTLLECYCADCQTAAHALKAENMLNDAGGTLIFQTLPANLQMDRGAEHLALMRLGPKGLFRWHAGCCGTPIANTLASPRFSFGGLVLAPGTQGFGPVTAQVQTKSARQPVREHGFAKTGFALLSRAIRAGLTGQARKTPFFKADGAPIATPRVTPLEERENAQAAAQKQPAKG